MQLKAWPNFALTHARFAWPFPATHPVCCLCTQTAACLSLPATLKTIVVPQNSLKTVLVDQQ